MIVVVMLLDGTANGVFWLVKTKGIRGIDGQLLKNMRWRGAIVEA